MSCATIIVLWDSFQGTALSLALRLNAPHTAAAHCAPSHRSPIARALND